MKSVILLLAISVAGLLSAIAWNPSTTGASEAAATNAPPAVPFVDPDPILEISADSLTTYKLTTSSGGSDLFPIVGQRGVGLDGRVRAGSPQGMMLAGNPFATNPGGTEKVGDVVLSTGCIDATEVDLALPAPCVPWVVGRSHNHVQHDGTSYQDSDGPQGANWFQISQPELDFYDGDPTEEVSDIVYLFYGADRFVEFKRIAANNDVFRAVNGAAGVIVHKEDASSEPDLYVYTDPHGIEWTFFGDDGNAGFAAGQIWKIRDTKDKTSPSVTYVGDATTASTAITNGYVISSPRISKAYDASANDGRRFSYTYTSGRLTEVKAETKTGGTWISPTGLATVGKVEYTYYSSGSSYGNPGDLEFVKVTTPLTDSGIELVQRKYFRYWKDTYNATTNPGHNYHLRLVLDFEGVRNFDYTDADFDDADLRNASNATLEPYAAHYYEYDSSHRVRLARWTGGCGGCGGGAGWGEFDFEYETNGSYSNDTSGYDEDEWMKRTIVQRPDGSYLTAVFDECHQVLFQVVTGADPDNTSPAPSFWCTETARNNKGVITDLHTPANVTAYTHSTGAVTKSTTAGLIHTFTLVASGTTEGYVSDRKWKAGTSAAYVYLDRSWTYGLAVYEAIEGEFDSRIARVYVSGERDYPEAITSGTTPSNLWAYEVKFHESDPIVVTERLNLALKQHKTTKPAVSTGNNGSGVAETFKKYFHPDGTLGWEKDENLFVTYREYTNGQITKLIEDADTGQTASGQDFYGITIPSGYASSGTELHRKTTFVYDAQGRRTQSTANTRTPVTYYSRLGDRRMVTLNFSDYQTSPSARYFGPVGYTVENHAGKTEIESLIALTSNELTSALTSLIDEDDADPITAVNGVLARLITHYFDTTGTLEQEAREYFSIPASEPGNDGTHYDPAKFAYDDSGRPWRVKNAHGTIRRSFFDLHGQVTQLWVGTNDVGWVDGESSGTVNMVKVEENQYDGGGDKGNGLLSLQTLFVQDSATDSRATSYSYDARGNVLLQTGPTAPHAFHKYDNMNRRIATGLFSVIAGIAIDTDDPTTKTTNRLALRQKSFDEARQNWKSQRHKIDDADGSDDDNVQTLRWFDGKGQVVKVDGESLEKTTYDRLGRVTHHFVLANDNDTAYAHADDVSGDKVLEESQTVYDPADGEMIMEGTIQRFHDDWGAGATTGALDTNADADNLKYTAANLEGRIQITAHWNGLQGVSDTVLYGTNSGSDLDRDGLSVPSRSDTALRNSFTYNTDGTLQKVEDPKSLVTKFEYDAIGRTTKEIRHYVSDTGPTGTDDNVTVLHGYTDGLHVTMTADMPSGTDQVTTYTHGTTKGSSAGDSKIATGHLLQKVTYPDSSDSGDVVKSAYNAQEEEIWRKDQEPSAHTANVFEMSYDLSGRQSHRRVTTLGTNFDSAVRRISTTYTSLGKVQLVTQYDNATVGSGAVVNEAKSTYDDWGNVEKYEEDRDSAVGASGSVNDYEVSYTYVKATTGRNTIRRTGATLPSGKALTYEYVSVSSQLDSDASRLTRVKDGATVLVEYDYLGEADVVGTTHDQPDVIWKMYTTSGAYPDLDRFNRVVSSRWTKDLATDKDFYRVDLAYDRNSNITSADEQVHSGFDVIYLMDDTDRLVDAEEGTLSGGTISSRKRHQIWTLNHTGNWDREKLDLDGDDNWNEANEHDDTRTHNSVNELTDRNTDSIDGNEFTLTYNPAGSVTDDGENYKYEYDAFYRLRKVKSRSTNALVAEYTYNGNDHRIGVHVDNNRPANDGVPDGVVDSYDPWYYTAYDERWRPLSTFRSSDSNAKEDFVLHQAGSGGHGGSSYINSVVCRYKDANTAWTSASDGTMEEIRYYCQNWRWDVSSIVTDSGWMKEWVKYSSYGVPIGLPAADTNSDGLRDSTDVTQIQSWIDVATYDVRGDWDLDGDVDSQDKAYANASTASLGRYYTSSIGNVYSFAGYVYSVAIRFYESRWRSFAPALGRWIMRDVIGYLDGPGLYQLVGSRPIGGVDPLGLADYGSGFDKEARELSRELKKKQEQKDPTPSKPDCPPSPPDEGTDPEWCYDDVNPAGHAGKCYRKLRHHYSTQCCYVNGQLTGSENIDLCPPCWKKNQDGKCHWICCRELPAHVIHLFEHVLGDVIPSLFQYTGPPRVSYRFIFSGEGR